MANEDRAGRFSIRTAYAESVGLIGRNAVGLLVLAVVLGWLPGLITAYLKLPLPFPGHPDPAALSASLGRILVSLFLGELLTICAVNLVLSHQRGLIKSLQDVAKSVPPQLPRLVPLALILNSPALIAFAVTLYLAFSSGDITHRLSLSTLSMIAGFARATAHYWILAWVGVAGAVFARERVGVTRSLARAAHLLDRERWRFMTVMIGAEIIGGLLVGTATLPAWLWRNSIWSVAERQFQGVSLVFALVNTVLAVAIAVCYRELSRLKDPERADEVAAVFD
jgi:hypothetical protein